MARPTNNPANPPRSATTRFMPWLFVLAVVVFIGCIRVRLLDMPLERDEGEYAYAGQLILQGIPPYELAYNMKLPGTYYAYALGMALFGQTAAGVHLTLLAVSSLTTVFVFLLARKLFGLTTGLVACASYGVMEVSLGAVGLAAHATQFVVLFAVPATFLLLRADETKSRLTLFFSGLLYGLAFLMVQQGICFCLFGCCFLVWRAVSERTIFSPAFARNALLYGLGVVLPLALFCVSCAVAGDFSRFWFWTFVYGREYATIMPLSEAKLTLFEHLEQTKNISLGLWLLAAAGPPLAWLNKGVRKQTVFVVVLWLFSFLGTAIGFYFRAHYFVLVLPAFAILVGMAVASSQRILSFGPMKNVLQTLPFILFTMILSWVIYYQAAAFFELAPVRICQGLYQWNPFVEAVAVGDYLRTNSAPDARIAVVGSEPEIYFYAHRQSATGYIYTYALMEPQPAALAMQHEMMQEIETNQPEYMVSVAYHLSWLFRRNSDRTIVNWVDQYLPAHYDEVGIVGYDSGGRLAAIWDGALTNMPALPGEYIRVYKRKPTPLKN